jgi:RimJ/RimL family protein N-acetyltransferase
MMRLASEPDRAAVLARLMPQAEYAMFPLNNLLHYGFGPGHPLAVTMWLGQSDGEITDVLTLTGNGMVLPFLPSADFAACRETLAGREVSGLVGPSTWVRGLEAALGLVGPRTLDQDEPHFLLDAADLVVPEGPGRIVPLADAPAEVVKDWMLDYQVATLGTPPRQASERVRQSLAHYMERQSHVVLMEGAAPLAMTGFNAQVPDMVQVGGVYTPPELRGQGFARRALALHLRANGARRATLFSASEAAARAYRALGFRQIGDWSLVLLAKKERVS